jgi:predicted ferric reductase
LHQFIMLLKSGLCSCCELIHSRPSGTVSKADMTALDLSADIGLLAVLLATANICLGLLIAVRYSPWRLWPHRRINIFAIHSWTAYLLLTSILIHAFLLIFQRRAHWRLVDVAFPVWSPVQPVENTIGAAGLYLLFVVVLTSHLRLKLGRRRWKAFHYMVYVAGACIFLHGILADPQLKGKAIDPLDGEKLLVESCLAVLALATTWAWRYRVRKARQERARGIGRNRVLESAVADD